MSSQEKSKCRFCGSIYKVKEVDPDVFCCSGFCLVKYHKMKEQIIETEAEEKWKVGDFTRAVWSEDGVEYEATIDVLDKNEEDRVYACLTFLGYGNSDTVWIEDLMDSKGNEARDAQMAAAAADEAAGEVEQPEWKVGDLVSCKVDEKEDFEGKIQSLEESEGYKYAQVEVEGSGEIESVWWANLSQPKSPAGGEVAQPSKENKPRVGDWKLGDHCRVVYESDGVEYECKIGSLFSGPDGQRWADVRAYGMVHDQRRPLSEIKESHGRDARKKQAEELLARHEEETARKAKEEAAAKKARADAEAQKAREEADAKEKKAREAAAKAREEAEANEKKAWAAVAKAREEAEAKKTREEVAAKERKAREESAKKAREEAAKKARDEAAAKVKKAKEEVEAKKIQAEKKAKEEAEKKRVEEEAKERKAMEEAAKLKAEVEAKERKAKEEAVKMKATQEAEAKRIHEENEAKVVTAEEAGAYETPKYKVGDAVRAIYSEDNIEYEGYITTMAISDDGLGYAIIKFVGYGNEETVWECDLLPSHGPEARLQQEKAASGSEEQVDSGHDSSKDADDGSAEAIAQNGDGPLEDEVARLNSANEMLKTSNVELYQRMTAAESKVRDLEMQLQDKDRKLKGSMQDCKTLLARVETLQKGRSDSKFEGNSNTSSPPVLELQRAPLEMGLGGGAMASMMPQMMLPGSDGSKQPVMVCMMPVYMPIPPQQQQPQEEPSEPDATSTPTSSPTSSRTNIGNVYLGRGVEVKPAVYNDQFQDADETRRGDDRRNNTRGRKYFPLRRPLGNLAKRF